MARDEQLPISEIARQCDLDRKTVRRCLKQAQWQPYQRPTRSGTLLAAHGDFLRERAPQVRYSAQVLFQELTAKGFTGGYDTVKRFVQPLRTPSPAGRVEGLIAVQKKWRRSSDSLSRARSSHDAGRC